MVTRIDWQAIEATPDDASRPFKALLVPIVAGLAQRLMVLRIPEQLVITLVRNNVIDDRCRYYMTELQVHRAERVI